VPVDNARTWSSQRGRHAHPAGVKGVEQWIILPYLPKGRIYIACGISTYQVDFPVKVARTHEGAHIRHRHSSTPCVGRYVVDPSGINHRAGGGIVATEDKSINPGIERAMYKRSRSIVTEIKGSHVVFMSQPRAVADVIEAAVKGSVK